MIGTQLPIESAHPVVAFARARLAIAALGVAAVAVLDFPYKGELFVAVALIALPWSVIAFLMALRRPDLYLRPWIAVGDLAALGAAEAVAPQTFAGVRFVALFFVAAHSHFLGERLAVLIALLASAILIPVGALAGGPVEGNLAAFYDTLFALSALAIAVIVGGLRSAESTGRLRARRLSRRSIERVDHVRRELAESLHDGPIQELGSLEMMLTAASRASESGEGERAADILAQAQTLVERNVQQLRDEMVNLGPQAFDELSFEMAIDRCRETWERSYGVNVETRIERLELPSEAEGALFRITQEAVNNAGRHAGASAVEIRLADVRGGTELRVIDDGSGFGGVDPLGPGEPGHVGLAMMRERAEMIGAELEIWTGDSGSEVLVRLAGPAR